MLAAGFRRPKIEYFPQASCSIVGLCPDGVDPSSSGAMVTSRAPRGTGPGAAADVFRDSSDAAAAAKNMRRGPDLGDQVVLRRRNVVLFGPGSLIDQLRRVLACLQGCAT
jgi:hypothetical protein